MLHALLLKGSFQDSVTLMVLSRDLSQLPDVTRVSVMMGTPANKDVFRETGLWHADLDSATPNDLCIVVDSERDDPGIAESVAEQVKERLTTLSKGRRGAGYRVARSWRRARNLLPEANVALISVAGHYAFEPARQALEDGCHVMMFSDNVSLDQELQLKTMARAKGLIVMGPDCGTAIVNKAPLAFANRIPTGPIAVIGASGTGIQEITSQIALRGSGITHAIGLGGRDLSDQIGGISALMALDCVASDAASRVVAFVSKTPAAQVKARIVERMRALGKPVVALFLGERPSRRAFGNLHLAGSLDEVATLAVELASADAQAAGLPNVAGRSIQGLYTGGTLAAEVALLIAESLEISTDAAHAEGFMLKSGGHQIVDLGDDTYTRGRPHPMIDPALRNDMIRGLAADQSLGVLLLDLVLGFGGHLDPASETAAAVTALRELRGAENPIAVIATVTGTLEDPQNRASQVAKLEEAGIVVADNVRAAVMLAVRAITPEQQASGESPALLSAAPAVINIGLRAFADDLHANGISVVHQQWEPVAGGNERLQRLLAQLQ